MNREVFITCAVTGGTDNIHKSDKVPITPAQIAEDVIASARAGAAIAHIHVRDPETGMGSRDLKLYAEVVDRVRDSGVDVIINLTAGMGGDLFIGDDDPLDFGPGSDLVSQDVRLEHVEALRPEICTLDCGTYNVGPGNLIYVSTSEMIRRGAERIRALGVKPELEVFELGHLHYARDLIAKDAFAEPVMVQLCLGVPGAAPATPEALTAMKALLPASNIVWSAFGVGAMQMPMVAQAVAHGGNVRVGLEDNLYLRKGVFATNAQLVERARTIIDILGARTLNTAETRQKIGLSPRH